MNRLHKRLQSNVQMNRATERAMLNVGTRASILEAALATFHAVGFDRATVAQIRSAAGVSNGSFFHFFASKELLAAELFLEALRDYHAAMSAALPTRGGAASGIDALLRAHVEWVVTNPAAARFLFEQAQAEWLAPVRDLQTQLNAGFAQQMAAWRQRPSVHVRWYPMSPELFYAQLIGAAQVICRAWLAGRRAEDPREQVPALAAAARRALLKAGSENAGVL